MDHRARRVAPAIAVLCLAVACLAASPTSAEVAPVTGGTVIEWRDPEVTRAGRPYDWRTHRIVAIEGTTVRYVHEGQGGGGEIDVVTREAYRGLVPLAMQVDSVRGSVRSRTHERLQMDAAALAALFPLTPGARLRVDVATESRYEPVVPPGVFRSPLGVDEWTVERREAIEVPAGRFDAVVILWIRRTEFDLKSPEDALRRGLRAERLWYVPSLGWPVRVQEGRLTKDGFVPSWDWRAVAIRRP